MRTVRTRSGNSLLGLPTLFFIYLLLGILGTLFSSAFFAQALDSAPGAGRFLIVVFISVPLVLLAFLLLSTFRLVRDVAARRPGGKLRARLLMYFVAAAVLSSAPSTIIASRFVSGILESWYSAEIGVALQAARNFALDSYRYRLSFLERSVKSGAIDAAAQLADSGDQDAAINALKAEDDAFVAVQSFHLDANGNWSETSYLGDDRYRLKTPPGFKSGFLPRDPVRDGDAIRYISASGRNTLRIACFSLGTGFDAANASIDKAAEKTLAVDNLHSTLSATLILLYAAFSLPTLLMTVIIAFSLSEMVTLPIVSLADATRRVAEGDFSIRILARPGDELGHLISSFNAMVSELENSRTALLRTEKINVWQDIAQRLAHEIKNPLTPIKLSAERILRRLKTDPGGLEEILEPSMMAIVQEVDGLSTLLTEFRTFARLPPPTLERSKLRKIIEDAAAVYQTSYPEIVFKYEAVDPELALEVDRRHISQVLSNLIVNAVDAMEGHGILEFRSELVKKRDSRYCRLSVRDNGKGIPEEDRALIFNPYFTTKETGTGLGLSIVERIVNDHGGTIWLDSAPGIGTSFYIDLPIDRNAAPRSEGARNQ